MISSSLKELAQQIFRTTDKETRRAQKQMRQAHGVLASLVGSPLYDAPTLRSEFASTAQHADTQDLAESFVRHGSDKSTRHEYHLAYGALLAGRRQEPLRILEIGIGTNDPERVSSMGADGKPGASLRAWCDWGPRFEVHGADVDENILFKDGRISTHWVDQTRPDTLATLEELGLGTFDLVIDDGLHEPDANLNTLLFAMRMIKPDGIIVIEDIHKGLGPFWDQIARLIAPRYQAQLLQESVESVFIVRPA